MFVTVKLRERKSSSGTSGSGLRAMRKGNAIVARTPAASATYATGSLQSRCCP